MNRIFRCFRIIQVSIGPTHSLSSCFDFGFEFVEIFIIENRLPVSVSRGVDDSPHRRVGDSPIPRIGESGSRLFEQILGPLKQRHHQRQKIFNNI